ncbi:hypothetical protein [Streptomyces sp. NL15-2K]|uniref:hypothetical protein n=1 Tax=Streptomyces sp. NL15-2K TaxID=376149 RepID=UPI000F580AFB|nr:MULTISPECIES: hypothetical protein [Actinomycetes]WKX13170.1 hypothetical protein Q4V64_38860 [Kutzneria buriramensis]
MDPRGDNAVPTPALLRAPWLPPERDAPDAAVTRDGGWSRTVMVICSTATVAAVVVLAIAGRLG